MKELLEKYPKAANIVKEYYLEKLMESLKANLPEEFKAHVREQGIQNDMIVKIMEEKPSNLFDVFDENKIYIFIYGDRKDETPNIMFFKFSISNNSGTLIGNVDLYKIRIEAEKSAIEQAFEILEGKL